MRVRTRQVQGVLTQPQRLCDLVIRELGGCGLHDHRDGQSDVTDRVEYADEFGGQSRRLVMSASQRKHHYVTRGRHGQRHFVARLLCQSAHFCELFVVDATSGAERAGTQHRAGRYSHRVSARVVGIELFGNMTSSLPTRARRVDIAENQPRSSTHVPTERIPKVAGGLQMFGYQGSVLLRRDRISSLERAGEAPMELCPCGFEL
jgi:hypothetical protein